MKACLKLQPDVLFQRIAANYKIESTEWEIYIKDVSILSQHLHCIMLHIHQHRKHITYMPSPDWLFQNKHVENKDQEITGISINMAL